jgi:hypothetical protein
MSNLYKCKPRQARRFIVDCIKAGLVPFLQSSPGMGKSSITKSVSNEFELKLIDHRLSTSEPTDMTGLPHFTPEGRAMFAPFSELFPVEGDPLPKGKSGWMIFLDEFNSAPRSVQAASYKLILDRMVGQHPLHSNVVIVAAGNLATDRAIVNPISTAMQSRVIHLEMEIDFDEWLEDVAFKEGYDSRIMAFLMQYPGKLMDFRPEHHEKTFCCPRTWEFVNRLIKNKSTVNDEDAILLTGAVTSGVAVEFVQFTKVYADLVTIQDIQKNPKTCPVPKDINLRWATISHMMEKVDDTNFADLATYIERFDVSFKILFFRSTLIRKPTIRSHPAFGPAAAKIAAYLHS